MDEHKITDFQKKCIEKCKRFLRDVAGMGDIEFEEKVGKSETFYKSTIKINNLIIELYVYLDEAGFMIDRQNWIIFERPDYSSEEQLIESFIERLAGTIRTIANNNPRQLKEQ